MEDLIKLCGLQIYTVLTFFDKRIRVVLENQMHRPELSAQQKGAHAFSPARALYSKVVANGGRQFTTPSAP